MEIRTEQLYKELPSGARLFVSRTRPAEGKMTGRILVAHGLGETSDYYAEFARLAAEEGYGVCVPELRGHGRTAGDVTSPGYGRRGGNPGPDSIRAMAEDLFQLAAQADPARTGMPLFLLGHSMGSLVAQLFARAHGDLLGGLVLTGEPAFENMPALLETANREIALRGPEAPSVETFAMLFGGMNRGFEPVRTPLDWITGDEKMADESLRMPYTAVPFSNEFYRDFLLAGEETARPEFWKTAGKQFPVLLLAGGNDPASRQGASICRTAELLRAAGFEDVRAAVYPGLRHSILRETKRAEVAGDILRWMGARLRR